MNVYNTQKEKLILKEYGRNVQNLVKHLNSIEDQEERNSKSETLSHIMKQINVNIKDAPEMEQKLWDDIHIISDFSLEVEGKFPKPDREVVYKKPNKVEYNTNEITFRHFGRNIELFVEKAIALEDPEEKESAIVHIGKLMKTFFYSYNRDVIDDKVIYQNIKKLSGNKLEIDMEKVTEMNLFEPQRKERRPDRPESREGARRPNDNKNRNSNNKGGSNNRRNFKRGRN